MKYNIVITVTSMSTGQLKERLDKMKKRRSFEAADVIQTAEKQRSSLEKAVQVLAV